MLKHLLLFITLATAVPGLAQTPAPPASTAVEFPTKDGKLYYEGVVEVNPSAKKAMLYQQGRTWFVNTYVNAKEVLQLDDKAEGKMMGKGTYQYMFLNGANVSKILMWFTLDLDVRDGKYRYRIYDFGGNNLNSSLLASSSTLRGLDFNQCYTEYKEGKRTKYNLKVLQGMDTQVKAIIASLETAMKKTSVKDDF